LTQLVRNRNNRTNLKTTERTNYNHRIFLRGFQRESRIFYALSKDIPVRSALNTERTQGFIEALFSDSPSREPTMTRESQTESPATLVAIIVAARRAGNLELEREMRRQLEQQFRVKLSFVREPTHSGKEANDAK